MNIVYIHGLDSDASSIKGLLLEHYCEQNHPDIAVYRPDLNQSPEQVFGDLIDLVTKLSKEARTILVGSSLGGYFSTLVSNHTGCSVLLLNPSTQPHITLQRFYEESSVDKNLDSLNNSDADTKVLYTTTGGWNITIADLKWFADHKLSGVEYPSQVVALIKEGDELLDFNLSVDFYRKYGAKVILQAEGDHRFSDFSEQLPVVMDIIQRL
ncbi:YqiA/YcfP family alpha/beta fold hydrolase [uncultured Psychrobacter sp.]|uniref:YqiA/YcfP family alpha/beta fold hydrolase n=1 Tax=uncultured Psychrobacter sp. TaxID=259303 RepID=UPI003458D6DD